MNPLFRLTQQLTLALALLTAFTLFSCSSNEDQQGQGTDNPEVVVKKENTGAGAMEGTSHGVGSVKTVELPDEIDVALASTGESIFQSKCIACHSFEQKLIGPPMAGVTERRNPAWIINMIVNPLEMTQKDPIAKALLEEYNSQMVNMNVTEEDARAILEFLRLKDNQD